jgi:hypothetical protein
VGFFRWVGFGFFWVGFLMPTLPLIQLGEGGPLEGVGPETRLYKTRNIHKRIQKQNEEYRSKKLVYIKLPMYPAQST